MTIDAKAFQNPEEILVLLVFFLLIVLFIRVALGVADALVSTRLLPALKRHRPTAGAAPLSALGLLVAMSSPAPAQRRLTVIPSRGAGEAAAPPWSATSGFPPPRPLVRTGASTRGNAERAPSRSSVDGTSPLTDVPSTTHPAVHPERHSDAGVTSLFPRERRYETRKDTERVDRERACIAGAAAHPRGCRGARGR